MEKKKWLDLSIQEKVSLLKHIFYYYNKTMISLQEIEDFEKIAKNNSDIVYYSLVGLFGSNQSAPTIFTQLMRTKQLDKLFAIYNEMTEEGKQGIREYGDVLLSEEFEVTYTNPEPNVPMSEEEIISDIMKNHLK